MTRESKSGKKSGKSMKKIKSLIRGGDGNFDESSNRKPVFILGGLIIFALVIMICVLPAATKARRAPELIDFDDLDDLDEYIIAPAHFVIYNQGVKFYDPEADIYFDVRSQDLNGDNIVAVKPKKLDATKLKKILRYHSYNDLLGRANESESYPICEEVFAKCGFIDKTTTKETLQQLGFGIVV